MIRQFRVGYFKLNDSTSVSDLQSGELTVLFQLYTYTVLSLNICTGKRTR